MPTTGPEIPVLRSSTTTPSSTPVMSAIRSRRHRSPVDVRVGELPPTDHTAVAEVQEHDVVVLVALVAAPHAVVTTHLDDHQIGVDGGEVVDDHVGHLVEAVLDRGEHRRQLHLPASLEPV